MSKAPKKQRLSVYLEPEVLTEALHVADAFDHHIPYLPGAGGILAQAVGHGHGGAVGALDLGAHGGAWLRGVALERQHLHAIAGEVHQRIAISGEQRTIERRDEAFALLGRGRAPVLAQHLLCSEVHVHMRQEHGIHNLVELRDVLAVLGTIGVEIGEQHLRARLDQLLRRAGIDGLGRHGRSRLHDAQGGHAQREERTLQGTQHRNPHRHLPFSCESFESPLLAKAENSRLISFSSTIADCVFSILLPAAR